MSSPTQRPVPAVRLMVVDGSGRVLILQRQHGTHSAGAWCLPGGKVDYGETVEHAAQKELVEETGLEIKRLRFLFYQDSLPLEPGTMHCINFYFECEASGALVLAEAESSAFAWIGPKDLAGFDIRFRNDDALRRYWNLQG